MSTPITEHSMETTLSITSITKDIKRLYTRMYQYQKYLDKDTRYQLMFKRMDVPEAMVKARAESKRLKELREEIKRNTPRDQWYPHYKNCGRYVTDESKVITQIMQEAFKAGFNVKSIAAYFNMSLTPVYRRIKIIRSC
jgi:hypothetical protein